MSLASKAKAAKKRERLKQQVLLDQQKTENNAVRLKTLTTGFARTERTPDMIKAHERSKMPTYVVQKPVSHTNDRFPKHVSTPVVRMTPEMEERELKAQERYREMKGRVGPAFNKGGYQYLGETELEAEKKGELRRRS